MLSRMELNGIGDYESDIFCDSKISDLVKNTGNHYGGIEPKLMKN